MRQLSAVVAPFRVLFFDSERVFVDAACQLEIGVAEPRNHPPHTLPRNQREARKGMPRVYSKHRIVKFNLMSRCERQLFRISCAPLSA